MPSGGIRSNPNRTWQRSRSQELSKKIGVVLTHRPQIQNMSVTELVALGRSPYTGFWGKLEKEDKKIVADAISLIGIENLKDRMIQNLSDGERQKVMIAKAIAQQTPIIFLDEPTAFLDFPSKIENNLFNEEEIMYAEERRLFYVALTRTKERIFILVPKANPSKFIEEIKSDCVELLLN